MEIPEMMSKTFWGVVNAAVEQSRRKANMVAQGDGKFSTWGWPQDPSKPKKKKKKKKKKKNITTDSDYVKFVCFSTAPAHSFVGLSF